MRKCICCGATKNLKGIWWDENDEGYGNHSICKKCYFENCSCEMDGHEVSDCLTDTTCENHQKTVRLNSNWDDFDYHFKIKKGLQKNTKVEKHD